LTPVNGGRTVAADGVRWTPGYTATIREPGPHRVEAAAGVAALRGPDQPRTDTVRRNGIMLPTILATASATLSLLVAVTVLTLRAVTRRRLAAGR
jgi:hypothetical protein